MIDKMIVDIVLLILLITWYIWDEPYTRVYVNTAKDYYLIIKNYIQNVYNKKR